MLRIFLTLRAGLLSLVLLVVLPCQFSVPAHAQAQTQSAPDPKSAAGLDAAAGTASAQSDLASKKVLILHSFAFAQPVYKIIDQALIDSFVAGGLNFNNLYFEFLDLARNPGQEYRNELINIFRQKYQGRNFDLVVALHQQSVEFLIKEGQSLYPEGPIICILGDPVPNIEHYDSKRPLIYLPFSIDVISTVKAIFTLQPDTQKIVVIAGSAPVDRRFLNVVQAALETWKGKLDAEFIPPLPLEEILKKVAHLPPKTAILYTNVAADSTGKAYMPRDVARMISQSANAPVFGLYETLLGENGIVGGIILNHRLEGERAVRSAMEILRGRLPSKPLTILPAPLVPMFDWPQLKRWGMNEAALPADAMILNRPVSAWERYRIFIVAGVVLCLAETALIVFLIVQRRRKKAAEGLRRRAEEKYRSIFEDAVEGIFETSQQGQPLTANPSMARTLGYSSPEDFFSWVYDTANQVWVNPNDRAEYVRLLEERNVVHSYETQLWRKDRTKIWVSLSGRRVYGPEGRTLFYSGFIEDITERKRAEEALSDRLRFEQLLSGLSARFVNILLDRVDSEIEDGLKQVLEFFQVDRCALLQLLPGKTSWHITHVASSDNTPPLPVGLELPRSLFPWAYEKMTKKHEVLSISRLDDLPAEANADRETCLEWGIRSYVNIPILVGESEAQIIHVNSVKSERVWPEELFPRLRLLGEIFVNALGRKRAEAETALARMELLHVERTLRLNELTGSLAHELNQPLAAILSSAQAALRFLKTDKPDLNGIQEILGNIISDDRRAGSVIRSVRSMMKREEGEKKPTNLNDILNGVLEVFRSEAISRNVRIEKEWDMSLPPIFGDKGQLEQVMLNLVMNGVEAMSRNPSEQRKLILRTQRKDRSIWVAVRDFGPGIDQDKLELVFQPFFTTKSSGLGIGLALCNSIIKAHRGRIWAENNPGGGATFIFELPIHHSGE